MGLGAGLSSLGSHTAPVAMQAKIMDQVKSLEPLSNTRLVLSVDEAVRMRRMLPCG